MKMSLQRFGAAMLVGAVALVGCNDTPTDPTPPAAAEVVVSPGELTFTALNESAQLSATVFDDDGQVIPDAPVVWTSSDVVVADVTEDGLVQVTGEGSAFIIATSGDAQATVEVVVELPVDDADRVDVEPTEVLLTEIGATFQLTARVFATDGTEIPDVPVTWSSSDEEIVTVTDDGEVQAIAEGTATVTASRGVASGTAEITVDFTAQVPETITVTPEEVLFSLIGETEQLVAVVFDSEGVEIEDAVIIWSSSDEDVVTVTEDGELEAAGEGTATVTATSGNVEATVEVTVELQTP